MNELMINLRAEQKVPLYEQIYDYIKDDIKKGRIQSGEKLPSTRALSAHLEVSRSTVELAYEQLLSEGYIEAQPYRGYFVCQIDGLFQIDAQENNKRENNEQREQKYRYDFTPSGVDLKSFPYNIWRKLSRECLVDDKAELFRLGCPQGEYGLRNAICSYLHQARGVNCTPEQIIVGAGNDYLLMLLGMILGGEHKIALENPTYKQAYRLFKNLSYEVCTVDMDDKGMRVDELRKSDADIAFVKLLVENSLAGVIVDRFGKDVMMIPADADHFTVSVDVQVSSQFISWVFALGSQAKIVSPKNVVNQVRKEIEKLAEQYALPIENRREN